MVPTQDYLKKHFKNHNPVFNIPCQNEPITTDTVMSDTPAITDGSTMAQFFCGQDTLVCDLGVYGIKDLKQFVDILSATFTSVGPWQPLSLMLENMKSPRKLPIFSAPFLFLNMNLNPIISTRTNLRTSMGLSNTTPTPS